MSHALAAGRDSMHREPDIAAVCYKLDVLGKIVLLRK